MNDFETMHDIFLGVGRMPILMIGKNKSTDLLGGIPVGEIYAVPSHSYFLRLCDNIDMRLFIHMYQSGATLRVSSNGV